ncbi:MAG: serine/threonine-protein kinase [Ruminococcus sp.]
MRYCPYCMSEMAEGEDRCPACGRAPEEYLSPPHTLRQGAMLNNRYLVGGVLGEGGFGITYIGLDTLLRFRVAIKEFFPNGMVNRNNTVTNEVQSISTESARELFSKSRENFLREARTLAKFTDEPGIVAVRDFFEENHTVYIVMEYLDGITLKSYLKQVGRISPYNTVCLLMPVFRSLQKIHKKGLIHRDISPDNIMLVGEQVKLLDFGAAREFADERSLSVMLKHGYAPMEQYRRHGAQGAWTDVYAICATMYKCITGSVPSDAPDRVFEDDLKMPSQVGVEIDPAFEEVLRRGLAVKPDERIQSIDELLEELDSVPGIDIGDSRGHSGNQEVSRRDDSGRTVSGITQDGGDIRLSEYVPHRAEPDSEAPPKREEPEQRQEPPSLPKKKKSNLPLILVISAVVVAAGIAAAVLLLPKTPSNEVNSSLTSPQTAAEETGETQTEPFSVNPAEIQYPDLGNYFHIENDFFTMDEGLFGRELEDVAGLFSSGNLFWGAEMPDFGSGYKVLCIPVDSPSNYGSNFVHSIDMIYKDNKLVAAQYEIRTDFKQEVVLAARERFGEPFSEAEQDIFWNAGENGAVFRVCMTHYDDDRFDVRDLFCQRYYAADEAPSD